MVVVDRLLVLGSVTGEGVPLLGSVVTLSLASTYTNPNNPNNQSVKIPNNSFSETVPCAVMDDVELKKMT